MRETKAEWDCVPCGKRNGTYGCDKTPKPNEKCDRCGRLYKNSGNQRPFSSVWKLDKSVGRNFPQASAPYGTTAPRSNTIQHGTGTSSHTTINQRSFTVPVHHASPKTPNQVQPVSQSITQDISSPGVTKAGGFMGLLANLAIGSTTQKRSEVRPKNGRW